MYEFVCILGQSYEIKLKKVGDLSEMKGKMLKTIIRVCFHDRRLQYIEKELIEQWKEQRPSERVIEIDVPLSYGIQDVRNDLKYINRSEFFWDPTKETGVFIRVLLLLKKFFFINKFHHYFHVFRSIVSVLNLHRKNMVAKKVYHFEY